MKKILIDIRELEKNKYSGIGRFLINLLENVIRFNDFKFIVVGNQKTDFDKNILKDLERFYFYEKIPILDEQIKLRKIAKKTGADVFFSPYYKYPVFIDIPVITCIFDLTYLIVEPYKNEIKNRLYIKNFLRFFTTKSNLIITSSYNTKNDILKFFEVDENKIKVLYLPLSKTFIPRSIEEQEKIRKKYNITKKYILSVGNNSHHKNLKTLYDAYNLLPENIKKEYTLLFVGFWTRAGDYPNTVILNSIDDYELSCLYSGASLFVFPSLYEGFGYPPLEAMACGAPVLSSNLPCMPEILKGYVEYFNPYDLYELKNKIIHCLNNKKLNKIELSDYSIDFFIDQLRNILKMI